MNWYLYLFRALKYGRRRIRPSYPNNWRRGRTWWEAISGGNWFQKILYELSWVDFGLYKLLKRLGEQKYIYSPSYNNAEYEIRWETIRRFELYVEGYMADIAYRAHDKAPDPMPPGRQTRKKWGLRALRAQAEHARERPSSFPSRHMSEDERHKFAHDSEKEARRWEELARIYDALQDWPWWEDRYLEEAPSPDFSRTEPQEDLPEGVSRRFRFEDQFESDAQAEKFSELMDKSHRLDRIRQERLENMYRRLIDRKDLLHYD